MEPITHIGELIKRARNSRNQQEFAAMLGVTQSSLSRYESGKSNPRAEVIEQCMRLVHDAGSDQHPSADELADRVRTALADPGLGQVRSAFSKLLDAVTLEHKQRTPINTALKI